MGDDELASLADDIREHGQREPIVVDADGQIVEGRSRWLACERLGVDPLVVPLGDADPLAVAISANVKRRKLLTVAQRSVAAAESWPLLGGKPGRGRKSVAATDLTTTAELARVWEVSESSLKQATALVERDPDAAAAVKAGAARLEDAYAALLDRERQQRGAEEAVAVRAKEVEAARKRLSDIVGETIDLALLPAPSEDELVVADKEVERTLTTSVGSSSTEARELTQWTKALGALRSAREEIVALSAVPPEDQLLALAAREAARLLCDAAAQVIARVPHQDSALRKVKG